VKKTLIGLALTLTLVGASSTPADAITPSAPVEAAASVTTTVTSAPNMSGSLKSITLKVGTAKAKRTKTRAVTVADLLLARKISLGASDYVKPSLSTVLKKKMKVTVYRVTTSTTTVTEKIPFPVTKIANSTMRKGTSKVITPGQVGSAERTYTITTTNGKITSKVKVSENILLAPVTAVVEVGTKGKALNTARSKMWHKIAKCESGGRWHINTGNGYYGGLQFNLATWRSQGGRDFASKPHKASKAEQITVANRLYAKRGVQPWGGCGKKATR
jgi:uncharacterized protein YabE (DUF348 family)